MVALSTYIGSTPKTSPTTTGAVTTSTHHTLQRACGEASNMVSFTKAPEPHLATQKAEQEVLLLGPRSAANNNVSHGTGRGVHLGPLVNFDSMEAYNNNHQQRSMNHNNVTTPQTGSTDSTRNRGWTLSKNEECTKLGRQHYLSISNQ